jgi:metal-dependent hydrolase (beta-lactamase superfamily II)
MLAYSKEDVEHAGDVLEKVYGTPQLYLNHCTGKQAIEQLRTRFGSDVVHDCFVGTELTFEI